MARTAKDWLITEHTKARGTEPIDQSWLEARAKAITSGGGQAEEIHKRMMGVREELKRKAAEDVAKTNVPQGATTTAKMIGEMRKQEKTSPGYLKKYIKNRDQLVSDF